MSATSSRGSSTTACRPTTPKQAASRGLDMHDLLTELAAAQPVGEHGLVALDWQSGNRSVLVDHELSGLIVGLTLATRPEDIYRALLEATAFGTRVIVEAFEDSGRARDRTRRRRRARRSNRLLMQIYSDVTRLPLSVVGSSQGPALGAAHARRRGRRRLPRRQRRPRPRWGAVRSASTSHDRGPITGL